MDVTRQPAALLALQLTLHFPQPIQRRPRLGEALVVGVRGRFPHGVGCFLQPPGGLHHLRRLLLARQTLEPARRLLGLFGQRALRCPPTGPRGLAATRPATLPLRLLFLATSQLLQTLHQFVDLVV